MKICNRYLVLFSVLIAQITFLHAQNLSSLNSGAKNKVDPMLQQAVIQQERYPARSITSVESYAAGTRQSVSYGNTIAVLIKCDDDINKYANSINGIRIGSRHGNIYTALVPIQSVAQLAQLNTVKYIEASRFLSSSLDLSVPKTGADVLHSYPDSTKRLTGKGIIIGFTDSGINTDHPNFKLPDGRTRILYVWDQYGSGAPPAGFTYGYEADSSDINAHTWSMSDGNLHGTHVSGIAAGNGGPSKQYVGMAPEADIIMVANQGDDLWNHGLTTVGTLDGYDYIRTKANALHKRFVINTSQGTNLGPHDGTTLFEQAVNADVAVGNIHCIAAGNEATSSRHASAVVTTSSPQVIQTSLSTGSGYDIPMDIWYNSNDRLVLRIKEASDPGYMSLFPPKDSTITYSLTSVDVTVTTKIGSPLNGDNEIYIEFTQKTSSCSLQLQFSADTGNTLPDGGRVDLWWERNYPVSFTTNVDQSITLGMPACADSAITVASYNNQGGSYGSVDDISTFSGRGPRRDGVLKPEIAGIGGLVTSSVSSSSYSTFSGTSMSSPHLAGAVALLLQQDTTLKNYQVRQKLFAAATADGYTGPVPNPTWGYGKLNVLKAAGLHGIPIINISKDTVYFTNAFIAIKSDDSVTIKNLGSEDLTISNVSVSDPIFSVDRTSLVIPPRSQNKLIVSVTPISAGNFSGSITITSNDSINPVSVINVLGYGDYSPIITVAPDSFDVTISEGDSTTRTLTIGNIGEGRLLWNISYNSIVQSVPFEIVLKQVNASRKKIPVIYLSDREANGIDIVSYTSPSNNLTSKNIKADNIDQSVGFPASGFLNANVTAGVIEDFETGTWPSSPWVSIEGGGIIVSDAYQGTYAIQDPGWYYRTDVTTGSPGDKLSMWVRPGDGRFYLGFGASSLGAWSLVAGVNTNTFVLQQNTGYNFSELASVSQSWVSGSWYKMEVTFLTGGVVVGRLYASDGKTLLNTVSTTLTGFVPAGVAMRGFGNNSGFTGDYITQDLSGKWLSTTPKNGIVAPNESQDVTIKFNAIGVKAGDYRSNIVINNNDPLQNPKLVPASLHIIGKPIIHVSPDTLKYGIAFIGITRVDTLVVENIGSDVLQVNNISVSDTAFHPNMTSFSIPSDGRANLLLTYVPASAGPFTATVSISSNDSSSLLKTIPIIGEAAYPPIITVVPDSFMVTLASGDSVIQTMTIGNAGAGSLSWNIYSVNQSSLFYNAVSNSVGTEKVMRSITSEGLKTIPGTYGEVRSIIPTPRRLEPGQLNSAINGIGKVLIIGDGSTEYSIDSLLAKEGVSSTIVASDGIYDGTNPSPDGYSTVILCDGYSGWGTGMPDGGQTAIVNFVNAGGNLIVMEWVAYEIYSGRYTVLAPYMPILRSGGDPGPEIYSVVAKGPITQGVDSIFSVTTATNVGTARFGTVLVRGTVCGDAVVVHDVGEGRIVQFACAGNFNSYPFSERNMRRLLLNSVFQSSLLSVTPSSGTIAAGSFQYVDVKFNAKNLNGGDYRGIISIKNNDPVNNPKNVPANLHVVGKSVISIVPDTVKAGVVYIGTTHIDTVKVRNIGSDVLNVTNVVSSIPSFASSIKSFSVMPGKEQVMAVSFTPTDSIIYNGTLTITSNDSLHPTVEVGLQGRSVYPPVITVEPDSFMVTLASGDSVIQTMTIGNAGAGSLSWNIYSVNQSSLFYNAVSNSVGTEKVMRSITSEVSKTIPGTDVVRPIAPIPQSLKLDQLNSAINGVGKVLIIGDGSTESSIDSLLAKEGISSTIVAGDGVYDGTNPSLGGYSTAILCDGYSGWSTGMPDGGQTAIVNFVNAGGNLIVMEWVAYEIYSGRYTILAPYLPVLRSSGASGTEVYGVVAEGPMTHGVDPTFSVTTGTNVGTARFGTVLVRGTVCGDAVVIHDVGKGRIVQFASAGNFNSYPFSERNMSRLLLNSVYQSSFVSVTPSSGTIAAGSFQYVDVKFNAKGVQPGEYFSNISITSNDPVNGVKLIPAHLTVTGSTGVVSDDMTIIPKEFALRQNYPNPFNPSTTIRYDLPRFSHVTLSIYNLLGKLVTTLTNENRPAGTYSVQWNCQTNYGTAASGVYFAVINAGDFRKTVKMVLLK